ncbi:MAG: putative precorrin-2 dehydrogenase [Acidimicrobiaceae bacterium]|nr:putative precorrin-2 dehydrogenase [Acidimicrobiaceae bacterium]
MIPHPRTGGAPSYPVALLLEGRPCLVVGGGAVAQRKVEGLLAAGAEVTVVAPEVAEGLRSLPVRLVERAYAPGDVEGHQLVVTATGRKEIDRLVHAEAEAAGRFVNAADDPEGCSFYLPAVLRRGAVSVAVSTDGYSPVLAGVLRDRVAAILGEEIETTARLLGDARARLHAEGRSTEGLPWRPLAEELLALGEAGLGEERMTIAVESWLQQVEAHARPRAGEQAE